MTGQELAKLIQGNQSLCMTDIKYTILHLLEEHLIQPSEIIDMYASMMKRKYWQAQAHFETNFQFLPGRYKGKGVEAAMKRESLNDIYNSLFKDKEEKE